MESIQEQVRWAASPMLMKGIVTVVFSFHIDGCATVAARQFSKQYNACIDRAHPHHYCRLEDADLSIIMDKNTENLKNLYVQMALHWHTKSRQWQ